MKKTQKMFANNPGTVPGVLTYFVLAQLDSDESFTARIPTLPGCIGHGKNLRDLEKVMKIQILKHIELLKKNMQPVPSDTDSLYTTITVRVP